jgi:hypothetical protein
MGRARRHHRLTTPLSAERKAVPLSLRRTDLSTMSGSPAGGPTADGMMTA